MSCLFSKFYRMLAVKPVIPEEMYAVPGRECSVYFFNMAPNGFPGDIEVTTSYGRQDEKRWSFTPSKEDAGKSFPLQIEWKAPDGTVLAVCKSIVKVADFVTPKEITILLLGDSLIECSRFPKFLRQQLLNDGYKVKFIGSHIDNGLPACKADDLLHEGIGGWRFADFASRNARPPIDVYDAATYISIACLVEDSLSMGGALVTVPDFTDGKWVKKREYEEDNLYDINL